MKKLIFTLLTALTLVVPGCKTDEPEIPGGEPEISVDNFPDPEFRDYVFKNFDTNNDGVISTAEALEVTVILVKNSGIKSLEGIQYFINLTALDCDKNQLSTLDVSKNTALEVLFCDENQLSTLDVSKNTALTHLYCGSNQLSTLDVSKNTALTHLWCGSNQLSTLDVSKNTALTSLDCDKNQLSTLDVSKNTALTHLCCESNQLSTLDVSKTRISGGDKGSYHLWCNMKTLATLKVKTTQSIYGVTESRYDSCIHPNTQIVEVD